jgi:hypothetical protein
MLSWRGFPLNTDISEYVILENHPDELDGLGDAGVADVVVTKEGGGDEAETKDEGGDEEQGEAEAKDEGGDEGQGEGEKATD